MHSKYMYVHAWYMPLKACIKLISCSEGDHIHARGFQWRYRYMSTPYSWSVGWNQWCPLHHLWTPAASRSAKTNEDWQPMTIVDSVGVDHRIHKYSRYRWLKVYWKFLLHQVDQQVNWGHWLLGILMLRLLLIRRLLPPECLLAYIRLIANSAWLRNKVLEDSDMEGKQIISCAGWARVLEKMHHVELNSVCCPESPSASQC